MRSFGALTYLELSYNEIRSLQPLSLLPGRHLVELYAASNKIVDMEGVSHLTGAEWEAGLLVSVVMADRECGRRRGRAYQGRRDDPCLQDSYAHESGFCAAASRERLVSHLANRGG